MRSGKSAARTLLVATLLFAVTAPSRAERATARIHRLAKLAGQALARNQQSRGERYLGQALEAARDTLKGMKLSPYGEFPAVLKAYFGLLDKRMKLSSASERLGEAIKYAEEGMDTIEELLRQVGRDDVWAIAGLVKGHNDLRGKVVWAYTVQRQPIKAIETFERTLDVMEMVLATLPTDNKMALGKALKQYMDGAGKLAKGYMAQGRKADAERVLERAAGKCSNILGSDHPQVVKLWAKVRAFRDGRAQ